MKTVFCGGNVYTGQQPLCQAFVVEGERFTFVGSDADALAFAGDAAAVADLEGKFVCSGFIDSHMHLLAYGNALCSAMLDRHTGSLQDMIAYFRSFAEENPVSGDGWHYGRGWNQDYFTDVHRMPNRYDLDMVTTKAPVVAVRACGHCLTVNSRALELLNITADTPCPEGGTIGMENGIPNGLFFDNAMELIYRGIPAPDKGTVKNRIRAACRALNAFGVTGCQTDDYCVNRKTPWQVINEAYRELEESGELTVRVYEQANFTALPELKAYVEAGNVTGTGSDRFRIGPLKLLGDGALGAHTAFLSVPYADAPETRGLPVFRQKEMDELVDYANSHNMQVAIHAIGDACLDRVLHAVENALRHNPRADHRHGVVHCQISRPDQLNRIAQLGLHVYAQSIFLDYDNHIVEQRVGRELASTSYNWKTLMDSGVSVSNGSDCPVEQPFVLGGIQCAVTRTTLYDNVGPYLPDQAFSVQEALDSYTIRSAEASFEESVKGSVTAGKLADFVILGENPFSVSPSAIKDIPVCATYVGGEKVYG